MAEVVGIVLGLVSLGVRFFDRTRRALSIAAATLEKGSVQDHGPPEPGETKRVSAYFTALVPSFQPQIQAINRLLLENSDDQLHKFRDAYIFDCNMTAFAGAIMGQVALTSLALPALSQTHWFVHVSFVISILAGLLAVYFAVVSQKLVAGLTSARQLRAWLTIPMRRNFQIWVDNLEKHLHNMEALRDQHFSRIQEDRPAQLGQLEADQFKASFIPREASGSAVVLLGAPSILLGFSLSMFLLGLGLYLLFVWLRNLDPLASQTSSRAVFLFYVTITFGLLLFFAIPLGLKNNESRKQELSDRILHRIYMLWTPDSAPGGPRSNMRDKVPEHEGLALTASLQNLADALNGVLQAQAATTTSGQDGLRSFAKPRAASAYAIPQRE